MFRKLLVAVPIAVLAVGGSTACATKKFVRTNVGEVNEKVDSLGRSVEETQERTRQNEGRITDVDQRAQAAAQAANSAAQQANSNATDARNAANTVGGRVDEMDKANRRLVFETVLSEDQGNFKFAKTELPDEAKAKLDEMISQLKADPKGAWFGDRRPYGQRRTGRAQRAAGSRARRSSQALPLRAAPDSAAQDERDQLRRRQAGRAQQDQGWPRA